ncbi:beta-ketoacyl synthase N-terminal-like domain-containing protein, partial [Actinomyces marseillensis]|uniref:beta-ketoacyl synthase N-terminal-like domain-containing protein n=1 Tax=Actinomyces marseillensis TaxID=1852376 RepID=UPI00228590E3
WGSGRTRQEAEFGEDFDLTAAGVLEMAWMMKLITWSESPQPGWYDASGTQVDEAEIYDRFRDEVVARSGIRRFNDDSNMVDCGSNDVRTVFLTSEQTFTVDTKAEAEDYVLADPSHTTIWEENGTWHVTKSAGSPVQVPARATLTRTVGGQIPQDFDPAQWGIPASMVEALDRIAVWNLVTAVDAFISSGFSPAELLQAVHPADVSSTQGTGIGGMESLRHVFLSRFLGEDRPQDILQEALPNVVAAHTMQSFIGGYGQMIHSVGACATAAVSIEEAVDKIRLGKSDFVVAGGIDDISVESLTGFGNMNATAESAALEARGITPRHFSRAGDRRRAGFLEAAGGGTLLVTRGDIAADLGLPVQAVVAYARSFADGAHTSIPAPGLGALAAARGGRDSALAHALADLGLSADDIAVVSKHDTSTRANDPNEAELHSRLSAALGRSEGNPLYVVSQKTLTGHAKGGAALFQAAGLIDIFRRQEIPANRSLDCLDPDMAQWMPLLWLRKPLDVSASPVRAGVGSEQTETHGATTEVVKPALLPDLFVPFAAPRVSGTVGSDPQGALAQERLLLWSVERAIHLLAGLGADTAPDHRTHVLLPGSPNRGIFGGDGAYGEAKAAFDAIATKWEHESGWPTRTTIAHPLIGWVQGTSLMGGNDVLVPAAQAAGVHVYTTEEIAGELAQLLTREVRAQALSAPVHADLTGGLADAGLDLPALARQAREQAAASAQEAAEQTPASVRALPNPHAPALAAPLAWDTPRVSLRDQIVIVGTGEIGTWGSGRTRQEAEFGEDFDLTAAGVLEMAWMMKLITWSESPQPGWYDASGTQVDEAEIYDRFRDEVVARSGIRRFNDDSNMVDCGSNDVRTVFLTSEQTFTVDTKAEAEDYVLADPSHTTIWEENGTWHVTKSAGSPVQVPARATLTRTVGGQIPQDFDPAQWGIPASMVEALDRIAVWNLVTAVDAFISSGFSPAELLQAVHPADVSSTQGTGIGGMESLRHVFLSRFLGEDRPQDILQEALPNVVAAHTMQSFIGGYGQMIHSVGACATAAVSIEEAVDKIRLGKSDFVVAGGIDDISVESLTGFGNMNATAESAALEARGITPRHFSRAGDRRRAGFLEAAGGGTLLVTRGDIAADLGLPVQAVVAYARSFADGAHTSIPAPGLGALAAARGGRDSALAHALADLGLSADDIAVVSKHDTSTRANDPNEAELHSRLSAALGRSEGNPLYVVSQKTLTGHAKGGAALFQAAGLIDIFRRQEIPANRSLDCLDPDMAQWMPLLWLRKPLDVSASPVRAGVLTSLGFGHIAAMVVLAHPGAFEAALLAERGEAALAQWRERAQARLEEGRRHLDEAMIGRAELFVPIEGRRLPADRTHEAEVALLLDPSARLGADGTYAGAEN